MTVTSWISITNGNLVVRGKTVLTEVPNNVMLTYNSDNGAFLGATASHHSSFHIFPIGALEGLRFVCCFRFKLWWMTQRMGSCGKDVPLETQFMLVESKQDDGVDSVDDDDDDNNTIYTVFLPLLEGPFRSALQGNEKNQIEVCIESGDGAVQTDEANHMVYMHSGANPFEVVTQAVKAVENHMQTFHHRDRKKPRAWNRG